MKHIHSFLAVSAIILVGCSNNQVPEPTPSAPAPASPDRKMTQLGKLGGDIAPSSIFARAALPVVSDLVQVSQPVNPKDKIADEGAPEWVVVTEGIKIVAPGNAVSEIAVDDTTDAHLFVTVQAEGPSVDETLAGLEILDPDGVRINKRAAKPGVEGGPAMSTIDLAGHKPGIYKVKHAAKAQRFGVALDVRSPKSKLVMRLKPSTSQHLLGNATTVDVVLEDDGKPVRGAKLTSTLLDPELHATPARVQFTEVGNGVYRTDVSSLLGPTDKTGAYLVDVRAEGVTGSGLPFFRQARTGFHFGIPTAKVTSIAATRSVDDASGLTNAFEVDVTLESKSLDRLEISGTLAALGDDGLEHPVAVAFTGAGYPAGVHKVTLRFDAGHVRLTHLEGPYALRNLKVFSLGTNALFQRVGSGLNQTIVAPRIERMALPTMTPALAQLVSEGTLFAK